MGINSNKLYEKNSNIARKNNRASCSKSAAGLLLCIRITGSSLTITNLQVVVDVCWLSRFLAQAVSILCITKKAKWSKSGISRCTSVAFLAVDLCSVPSVFFWVLRFSFLSKMNTYRTYIVVHFIRGPLVWMIGQPHPMPMTLNKSYKSLVIHKLDESCLNNFQQVCKFYVAV